LRRASPAWRPADDPGEHRLDRAAFDAGVAVDALARVDVEVLGLLESRRVGRWMNAVDRQTSTHDASLVPMHGSAMTYAICQCWLVDVLAVGAGRSSLKSSRTASK
jgi:hypothetical protein